MAVTTPRTPAANAHDKATRLSALLLERLNKDNPKGEPWDALVLAALQGDAALDALIADGAPKPAAITRKAAAAAKAQADPDKQPTPATATLKAIHVEGFRGIGKTATLTFPPGPGLTLVVGRNGSGKSSFAEALELLLTGDTFRWSNKKSKVWKEGWRNLHHPTAKIEAELILEGEKGPATVTRRWADDAPLDRVETAVQVHGKPKTDLAALGWTQALVTHRPFLSYNELGSMLEDGPSKLYDALASILGLDDLVAAQERLKDAHRSREKAYKDAAQLRAQLLAQLPQLQDERAQKLAKALTQDDWGLDQAERIVAQQDDDQDHDRELTILKQLANLPAPDDAHIQETVKALREAARNKKATEGTLAERSKDLAEVLEHALRFHERHGDAPCPVCGRKDALTAGWHEDKTKEMKRLRDAARDATTAQQQASAASRKAAEIPRPRKDQLTRAAQVGLDPAPVLEQLDAWDALLATVDLDDLAARIEKSAPPLRAAITDMKDKARTEASRREDAWRPLALQIAGWLAQAREARDGHDAIAPLKKAEAWLKDTVADLRNQQFAPIKEKCQAIWTQLRQQSNVALEDVRLSGTATARKVELSVTVDGVEGAALGVMSQGELHALALSLFIPRATLPESPFRFIVIDDPVQSMDPARVDGLARVLESAAKDRQVVVFTHDDRLPEAVRRMGIAATVLEVYRRESSAVEVRKGLDPVARHIADAMAIARTEGLPDAAAKRVIPGLCRMAIEAACIETIRRRRLCRGERHADVEDLLTAVTGTTAFLAFALFDDPQRAGDVLPRLNKESKESADLVANLNKGAHGFLEVGYRVELIRRSETLARWIQVRP